MKAVNNQETLIGENSDDENNNFTWIFIYFL